MTIINNNLINKNFNLGNSKISNSYNNVNSINNTNNTTTFGQIFSNQVNAQDSLNDIQFSKHASMRLDSRNLQLNDTQIQRVKDGIIKANEKGIKDSLVLVDDIALVVNVKSKTVITAIENNSDKVYSNIDGAVIV